MTWIPIFSISSQDFDNDLNILKSIFNEFEAKCKVENGYKFSTELNLQWDGGFMMYLYVWNLLKN